jgi:hypothetical protein
MNDEKLEYVKINHDLEGGGDLNGMSLWGGDAQKQEWSDAYCLPPLTACEEVLTRAAAAAQGPAGFGRWTARTVSCG